jgi:small redox-active disulfide protein 2
MTVPNPLQQQPTNKYHTMKKIQILGTGCTKCNNLAEVAKKAADELGTPCEIEKVTDMMRFADFGVMVTPALVVDGVVKSAGKVPSLDEAKALIAG